MFDLETSVLYFYMGVIVKKPAALIFDDGMYKYMHAHLSL